jgi:hypothetical protein
MGSGWLHILNILFSFALQSFGGGDECEWYYIHITLDTTLGVFVNYQLHKLAYDHIVPRFSNASSGDYMKGATVNWNTYIVQLLVWLLVVTGMKVSMILIMLVFPHILLTIASFILSPTDRSNSFKLFIVMVLNPLVMNTFQFWITDSFLQKDLEVALDRELEELTIDDSEIHT